MYIPRLLLMVTSKCQNTCKGCATQEMQDYNPKYDLSMRQLEHFVEATKKSGYSYRQIRINGPGEPTLWTHFEEG